MLLTEAGYANVIVGATRVVFPGGDKEVTLRLSNPGDNPALVEAWIDSGDLHSTPDSAEAPFLVTPPLFRMEAHREQSLRIFSTPFAFPGDRESLFWLNVLDIPPKPTGPVAAGNYLQFAVRSRLKLFYRPATLREAATAPAHLRWSRPQLTADSAGAILLLSNPTPYYITLIQLTVVVDGHSYPGRTDMVSPFGTLRLPVEGLQAWPASTVRIEYETVNDYGAAVPGRAELGP
ncbi:fimbrial biogenesis chaperone [Frateuria aurantia]